MIWKSTYFLFQPIFNLILYKDNIFNVQKDKLCFLIYINSFWIWCLEHIPKQLGQWYVYHCVTSLFHLTTLNKCLWIEDSHYWRFVGWIIHRSCSCSCSHNLTNSLLVNELFGDAAFIPNHARLFTMNLFTCGMFQMFLSILQLQRLLMPQFQHLWNIFLASNSKWVFCMTICHKKVYPFQH